MGMGALVGLLFSSTMIILGALHEVRDELSRIADALEERNNDDNEIRRPEMSNRN